jgi:hypothetical protein
MKKFLQTLLCILPFIGSCSAENSRQKTSGLAKPLASQSFVKVVDGRFQVDGSPFTFVGSNFYRLAMSEAFNRNVIKENKSGVVTFPQIDKVMENYANEGFKVIRLWSFACEGSKGSSVTPPFINKDLSLNLDGLQQLDYTIASASQHGLRVILPLVNFEHEYCGMEWWVENSLAKQTDPSKKYMTYSCVEKRTHHALKLVYDPNECKSLNRPENPVEAVVTKEFFYTDPIVKNAFKTHVRNFLGRTNPYNGLSYSNDPAIFAIELSNEPHTTDFYECLKSDVGNKDYNRCSQENPNSYRAGDLVYTWLDEMSTYVRTIDSKHLITTGEEGYRNSHQDPSCLSKHSWINNGMKGVDFARNATLPNIDFMTTHLYPDNWNVPTTDLDWFNRCIIADRAAIAARNGKPIILEEAGFSEDGYVGKPDDYRRDRAYYLSRMLRYTNQADFQGTMVWQAAPLTLNDQVAEDDSFTFPIKLKVNGQLSYTPEGHAMNRQVACQKNLLLGTSADACVYICPRATTVGADRLGYDPDGYRCFLPENSESSGLQGFPKCTANSNPKDGWGWIQDAAICQLYTIGNQQYKESSGCSCKT